MRVCVDHAAAPVTTWERRTRAALGALAGAPTYRRREPEKTLLHAVVRDRLEPFLAAARDRSTSGRGLPAHVERDLRGTSWRRPAARRRSTCRSPEPPGAPHRDGYFARCRGGGMVTWVPAACRRTLGRHLASMRWSSQVAAPVASGTAAGKAFSI